MGWGWGRDGVGGACLLTCACFRPFDAASSLVSSRQPLDGGLAGPVDHFSTTVPIASNDSPPVPCARDVCTSLCITAHSIAVKVKDQRGQVVQDLNSSLLGFGSSMFLKGPWFPGSGR